MEAPASAPLADTSAFRHGRQGPYARVTRIPEAEEPAAPAGLSHPRVARNDASTRNYIDVIKIHVYRRSRRASTPCPCRQRPGRNRHRPDGSHRGQVLPGALNPSAIVAAFVRDGRIKKPRLLSRWWPRHGEGASLSPARRGARCRISSYRGTPRIARSAANDGLRTTPAAPGLWSAWSWSRPLSCLPYSILRGTRPLCEACSNPGCRSLALSLQEIRSDPPPVTARSEFF